jgi:GAF domain-containing protein
MGLTAKWNQLSSTFRYSVYGALFGLLFPVFATLGDLLMQRLPVTLNNLLQVQMSTPLHWVIDTAPVFLGLFASFAGRRQDRLGLVNQELSQQIGERDRIIQDLYVLQDSLGLHSRYLEVIAEVAPNVSSGLDDPQTFISQAVELIGDRLGFYHVGLFVLDESEQRADLRAASSEGGRRMLTRGHRVRVGERGIVGPVLSDGQRRIVRNIAADAGFLADPGLSETRSEMALPVRVRGEVIGVLDVQSVEPEAFSEEDIVVAQVLADLIAVAISNARLFRQAQANQEAMRRAYGELGREAWQELLRARSLGERYDPEGILPSDGELGELASAAVREVSTVLGEPGSSSAVAAPIQIRGGQVIGVLDARKPDGTGEWSPQELELLQSLVDQLGVALDGAQLYQESQERAERERVIGQVAARMRETLTADAVLQVAVREIGEALGIDEVEVRMRGEMGFSADALRENGEELQR